MKITAEALVELIVARVIAELARRGIEVDLSPGGNSSSERRLPGGDRPGGNGRMATRRSIDMRGYRSPVLTEACIAGLPPEVEEIDIPASTVVTPGARDLIKQRRLIVHRNSSSTEGTSCPKSR